ncbi:MAG TPA: type VI secretion system tip protein TssI/VgrG [Labilithrix sp.]|nr:type VI secretion system tip protein TssI/VgrG [Labilithrix sp.]
MPATKLTIDGRRFDIDGIRGREAVGEHFRIDTSVNDEDLDGKATSPADLVGKDFELTVAPKAADEVTIQGIVVSAEGGHDGGIHLQLGPEAELLTVGQGSHVYLDKTSVETAKAVLARAGVAPARWSVSSPPTRPYTAQYREDDWTFVERVTRDDGLYFFYDHDGGTQLVFADDSTKAPPARAKFLHRLKHGTISTAPWVSHITTSTVFGPDAFATRDRDPLKPKLDLSARATEGDGKFEVYEWPARAMTSSATSARAKAELEALRAERIIVRGRSANLALRCGKLFEIEDSHLPARLTKLFCIAIDWTIADGSLSLVFTAIPSDVPFRLPRRRTARASLGVETAFVRGAKGQEIDVDGHARVFAQPTWDREGNKDDSSTIRARVGQPALARSMAIPRIGWSTLVGYYDDDIDRPWVMARLTDGKHPPAYKLPDDMTKTSWQTLTSPNDGTMSEIVLEDRAGAERIDVTAARDMTVTIGDNEARAIGNSHVVDVAEDHTVRVDADDKLSVTRDQTTSVKGAETMSIGGSSSITVHGSETTHIGGARTEETKADRTVTIGQARTLKVGGAMSTKSKELSREVLGQHKVEIGGAWRTETTNGGLSMTTKGDSIENVGGACTQNGQGIATEVNGDLTDDIAGDHVVTATNVSEAAQRMTITVASAMRVDAQEIELTATNKIAIACGGATITITSSEVSVKAPMINVDGPLLSVKGAAVKHNP